METNTSAQKKRVKSVEFAYPSSETAHRLGRGKSGCWCVMEGESGKVLNAVRAYSTRWGALRYARTLPHSWDAAFAHCYPADAAR